jgi:hypothetical protein
MQSETVWFIGAFDKSFDVFADELVQLFKDKLRLLDGLAFSGWVPQAAGRLRNSTSSVKGLIGPQSEQQPQPDVELSR